MTSVAVWLCNNLRQVVNTYVPLSPSNIIWYWAKGRWCSAAGKVTAGLTESNGSRLLGGSVPGPMLGNEYGRKPLPSTVADWLCDVCRQHEHGEDMLAPMSAVLNDYLDQHHSSAVCLVLRGLHALCEAEVWLLSLSGFNGNRFYQRILVVPLVTYSDIAHFTNVLTY